MHSFRCDVCDTEITAADFEALVTMTVVRRELPRQ